MPAPSAYGMLVALREQVKEERRQELVRAIASHGRDPLKAAYHTGLADGRNAIAQAIDTILNTASISKGDNASGRQHAV